jgi:hypothetical protein
MQIIAAAIRLLLNTIVQLGTLGITGDLPLSDTVHALSSARRLAKRRASFCGKARRAPVVGRSGAGFT